MNAYQKVLYRLYRLLRRVTDALARRVLGGEARRRIYDIDKVCPELRRLEENFAIIREELDAVLPDLDSIPAYHEVDERQAFAANGTQSWRVLFLHMRGGPDQPNQGLCPRTAELLEQIPKTIVAFFSILEPRKSVPRHRASEMAHLRYHLALRVPERNPPHIDIAGESYTWREGQSLLWDDTLPHEVFNECDEPRVILIVDVIRELPWPVSWLNAWAVGLMPIWSAGETRANVIAGRNIRTPDPNAAPVSAAD